MSVSTEGRASASETSREFDKGPESAIRAAAPTSSARWWLAVLFGLLVSTPLAWLLSYAGMLPFFLGLFFFVLFGLIIGATMHRVASVGRPYGRWVLLAGTTIVVLFGWSASIAKESWDFPTDTAVKAGDWRRSIGEQTIDQYRSAVAEDIRRFLRERYPPGGSMGYLRWILLNGELKKGEIAGINRTVRSPQRGVMWGVRVTLSIALLGFGIGSQTLPLRFKKESAVRMMDEKREATST